MKWVYRIFLIAIGTVTVCALTVITTGFVVNAYVQSLLSSMNMKWEGQPTSLTSMMKTGFQGTDLSSDSGQESGSSTSTSSNPSPSPSDSQADNDDVQTQSSSPTPSEGTTGLTSASPDPDSPTLSETQDEQTIQNGQDDGTSGGQASGTPDGALPVMGTGTEEEQSEGEALVVSPDELQTKKDQISDQEKNEVFAMLMKKLPQDEMQKITIAMEGGLTESELIQIEQILSKYLDKNDYAKMMDILSP